MKRVHTCGRVVVVAALWILFAAAAHVLSANDTPTLKIVLSRAGDYVVRFERELATLVAEERYTQEVVGAEPIEHRELRSDLLFVRPGASDRWLTFRDVFAVNGRAVRDREERLARLFIDPS